MMVIYKILTKSNNKIYIGSAINFKKRKESHLKDLKNNNHHSKYLQRVYNKYGKNNLEFSILTEIFDKKYLLKEEQYWLDYYQPFGKNGYNSCKIAGSMLGFKHSEKTKQKISNLQKTPIIQYSKEGEFIKIWESAKIAANYYNTTYNNIINGKDKNCLRLGFLWKSYSNNYLENKNSYIKEKNKKSKIANETYLKNQKSASQALIKTFSLIKEDKHFIIKGTNEMFKFLNISKTKYYKNKNYFLNLHQIKEIK
jgi:group I intron endonuclease